MPLGVFLVREDTLQTGYVSECLEDNDPHGVFYYGTQSITTSGETCQHWANLRPHSHAYSKQLMDEQNYCRNGQHGYDGLYGPWCYTMNPNIEWEYCDNIKKCCKYT